MPERYLLANAPGVDRRSTRGSSRSAASGAAHAGAGAARATPRPPSSASWPTIAPASSRASPRRSRRAASRSSARRSTRGQVAGARVGGGRPLLGARPRRRDRRGRARRCRAWRATSRTSARGRVDAGRAAARAHGHGLALARAAEPRGADGGHRRRPGLAAPHRRRGVREGSARPALRSRQRPPRARPVDRALEDQHRGDARGRRLLRERARRQRGSREGRATRRSTTRSCWLSRAERDRTCSRPFRESARIDLLRSGAAAGRDGLLRWLRWRRAAAGHGRASTPAPSACRGCAVRRRRSPKARRREPPPTAEMQAGIKAFDAGNFADARKAFEAAVKKNPKDYQAYYNLGHVVREARRQDGGGGRVQVGARRSSRSSTRRPRTSARSTSTRGASTMPWPSRRPASRSTPGARALHENMGVALAARGDQDNASKEFAQAVQIGAVGPDVPPDVRALAQRLEGPRGGAAPRRARATLAKDDYAHARVDRASSTGWPASSTRA